MTRPPAYRVSPHGEGLSVDVYGYDALALDDVRTLHKELGDWLKADAQRRVRAELEASTNQYDLAVVADFDGDVDLAAYVLTQMSATEGTMFTRLFKEARAAMDAAE